MTEGEAMDSGLSHANELRHEAERRLRDEDADTVQTAVALADAHALVHELQVHQIELEMQKEELLRAHAEAQQASEKYGDLFDFAPVGYFVWDAEGRILEVNLAGARLLGQNRNAVTQKRFVQFLAREHRTDFADFCHLLLATDTKQTCEVKLLRGGQSVYVLVEGVATQDPGQGRICRAAVIDITQQRRADELAAANQALQAEIAGRKRAEEQLRALNETLEERVAERTAEAQWRANQLQQLAAQMTQVEERERRRLSQVLHDGLQQVLVAAKIKLALAKRGALDERATEAIKEAVALIDESLGESRSLTKELSPPVLYDGGLAAGLEWLGREKEKTYHLAVTVQVDPTVEPDDLTTKVFVYQAARELILNAVKHAHASSLKVHMSRMEGDRLQVIIEDNGKGFDPQVLKAKDREVGFGLFSIRERLDVIGGQLDITSVPGQGTKGTITVPYKRVQQSCPTGTATGQSRLAPDVPPSPATRIRVLLADDHPVLRKGLADMLRGHPNLNVVGDAKDGQEAMEMALQLRPNVVLMDITMPRMDGIEATRRIKQAVPDVTIVGLSMHETEEMVAAMKNAGANEYISKTAPLEELVSAILRLCPRT
jgi:PAS domain S-box-containing protein